MATIDLVIPVFNEGSRVQTNLEKIAELIKRIPEIDFAFILVDDGSSDQTHDYLQQFLKSKPDGQLVRLTRNFGKEGAILAGLTQSRGNAVLIMDSDLQHPPEFIEQMVKTWQQGLDVVEGCKLTRGKEELGQTVFGRYFLQRVRVSGRKKSARPIRL
ncbi:MAG: glycosyltransferase [Desulfovermiculus sp.]|nr:glycosyltransferase [Desulfovermiculus sp.]